MRGWLKYFIHYYSYATSHYWDPIMIMTIITRLKIVFILCIIQCKYRKYIQIHNIYLHKLSFILISRTFVRNA